MFAVNKLVRTAVDDPVKFWTAGVVAANVVRAQDEYWTSLVLGGVASSVVAKLLKRALAGERPKGASKSDNGMPSSHAHQLAYLSVYALARGGGESWPGLGVAAFALLVGAHRVRTNEHTPAQVAVGFVTGALTGLAVCYVLLERGGSAVVARTLAAASPLEKGAAFLACCAFGAFMMGRGGRWLSTTGGAANARRGGGDERGGESPAN